MRTPFIVAVAFGICYTRVDNDGILLLFLELAASDFQLVSIMAHPLSTIGDVRGLQKEMEPFSTMHSAAH